MLLVLPLLLHARGAALGEPVADDFDCLYRVRFAPGLSLFDGYGSAFYWRPLSRQIYFAALAPVMTAHPALIATLHALLLALTTLFLHRALRGSLPGPVAAMAASFPLLMESARMLISWPSNFQDLGAVLFAAVAIQQAAAARLGGTLAALLASLLCKELAAPAALLLAWVPGPRERSSRLRWTLAIGALLAAWGAAYAVVHAHAHLAWPGPAPGAAASWPARLWWARVNTWHSVFSLPSGDAGLEPAARGVLLGLVGVAIVMFFMRSTARTRLRGALPWTLWGGAWFILGLLPLAATWPDWSGYRGIFAAIGLGISLTALLAAAHPSLAAVLLVARLGMLAVSPGAPARVTVAPQESGALLDFVKLARVQRLVEGTRHALQSRFPTLPPGARVGQHYLPRMTEYAFMGGRALRVWYRDSTLSWVRFEEYSRRPALDLAAIVEYQPDHVPQVALVDPPAMRALLDATDAMRRADWAAAGAALDRADSLQRDPGALVFRATVSAKRAVCMLSGGDSLSAEHEALTALALWRDNFDSRFVLATVWAPRGMAAEAIAQLDTLLATRPDDRGAYELRERIRAMRPRATGPR